MRNDHTSYPLGGQYPRPEDIEHLIRGAHRLRAEAVHAHLKRVANWLRWPFRADRIKVTVPARAATC